MRRWRKSYQSLDDGAPTGPTGDDKVLLEDPEPHIYLGNLQSSEHLFVSEQPNTLTLVENHGNNLDFTFYDGQRQLIEAVRIHKRFVSRSVMMREDPNDANPGVWYSVGVETTDHNDITAGALPYESACDLYNFILQHTQGRSELKQPLPPVKTKKKKKQKEPEITARQDKAKLTYPSLQQVLEPQPQPKPPSGYSQLSFPPVPKASFGNERQRPRQVYPPQGQLF